MNNLGASPANQLNLPFDSLSLGEARGRLYQNKHWLFQKYVIEQLSGPKIARLCNVGSSTIDAWLNKLNIKKRNHSEAMKLVRKERSYPISEKRREKLRQRMLGKHNPFYGKKHSQKTRNKMKSAWKERWANEEKKKQYQIAASKAHKGYVTSEETKRKMSKGRKGYRNHTYKKIPGYNYDNEGRIILKCAYCNSPFKVWPKEIRKRPSHPRYCSRECQNAGEIGERASNWHGGISFEPYGLEFNATLRKQIRKRDEYTCQLCNIKENGKAHSCHHIDYNKKNNCPSNFALLCQYCHSTTNGNRFFWETNFKSRKLLPA